MHHGTVDRLILFQSPDLSFLSQIKNPQEPILAARVNDLIMFPEPNRRDIPFKIGIKGSLREFRTREIINLADIVHACYQFLLIFRYLDSVRN